MKNKTSDEGLPFSAKKLNKDIILVTFDDRKNMCDTLLRFQEYYESPDFRGKPFTLGQYREHSINERGIFDYPYWVAGCNFPSSSFDPFLKGMFDPLTEAEELFLECFGKTRKSMYIIAVPDGCHPDTIKHEVCHALFGTNEEYRKDVEEYISKIDEDKLKPLKKFLSDNSYCEEVFVDEINAYITADSEYLKEENNINIDPDIVKDLKDLREMYGEDLE